MAGSPTPGSPSHDVNLTTVTPPSALTQPPDALWIPKDAPLLAILAVNTLITLVSGCVITACVIWIINRRAKQREERDKLAGIIRSFYWDDEEKIISALQTLNKIKKNQMFRDVTELHVLAYKYRTENGVYGETSSPTDDFKYPRSGPPQINLPSTIKKVERFFDSLTLQLPCVGQCPANVTSAFGGTLYGLCQSSALMWSDHKAAQLHNLVQYFVGKEAAERFNSLLVSDDELETLVLARIPYVYQLYLSEDHFVLRDIDISTDLKIDLRNKIRYIDTVLGKNDKSLQVKEKNLIESYYMAREICLKNNFIPNKHNLPDIITKAGETSKVRDCVTYLRHLLRMMCIAKNIKRIESDDRFFQFLMQLHETLYTWADTGTMIEVIERSRTNILTYLRGLTVEQILMDKEFTKAKLEHLEKELYKHLNYLTLKQVAHDKSRRQVLQQAARHRSMEMDPKLRSVDSEASIYTMAMSTSSFMMRRQPSQASQSDVEAGPSSRDLTKQPSIDQSSLLSATSSMYATAASMSSAAEAGPGAESTPLMGRPATPHRGEGTDGQQSPTSADSDYFETAV